MTGIEKITKTLNSTKLPPQENDEKPIVPPAVSNESAPTAAKMTALMTVMNMWYGFYRRIETE